MVGLVPFVVFSGKLEDLFENRLYFTEVWLSIISDTLIYYFRFRNVFALWYLPVNNVSYDLQVSNYKCRK